MKRSLSVLFVTIAIMALCTSSLAQKAPKYDVNAEQKIKGAIIQEVKTSEGAKPKMELVIKDGLETYTVILAPKAFLDMLEANLTKDDKIDLTVCKVKLNETETVMLAREIVKGNNTIVLRDKNGEPAWLWLEKDSAVGK